MYQDGSKATIKIIAFGSFVKTYPALIIDDA